MGLQIYRIFKKEYLDYKQKEPNIIDIIQFYYNSISYRTLITIRLMKYYAEEGKKLRAIYYKNKLLKKYGMEIGLETIIGKHLMIPHPIGIVIGKGCKLGDNCKIYQNVTIGRKNGEYPCIGNDVVIYPGAVVVGSVKIGDNVIVGANAVVLDDLPNNAVAAGIPADIIRIE